MSSMIGSPQTVPNQAPQRGPHWIIGLLAPVLLLVLYAGLALSAVSQKCNTSDEIAHLTPGYIYWTQNNYRFNPENGNLPQRWAALPLLAGTYRLPPTTDPAWKRSEVYHYGKKFLFEEKGNDAASMLFAGRAMMVLMGVASGLVVYLWSRRLFGPWGGLVSLGLFCLCPTMLAHGPLITSDMTAALFFLLALAALWRLMHQVDLPGILLCGLAVGGLCIAKYSAPLIVPMALLLLLVRLLRNQPLPVKLGRAWSESRRWVQAIILGGALVGQAVLAIAIIWAAYGFRYSGSSESAFVSGQEHFLDSWDYLLDSNRLPIQAIALAREHHWLPEAYLYGMAHVLRHAEYRSAYLAGDFSITGFRMFFPYAVLVKTPLVVFALIGLAAIAAWRRWHQVADTQPDRVYVWPVLEGLYATAPLWVLLLVYWPAAILSTINIGHRHVLVTYPVMFILCGAVGWLLQERRKLVNGLVAAGFVLLLVQTVSSWPHYLAYFNEIVGGPSQGYLHLVDSSLDWGQDLPELARWISEHRTDLNRRPYLAYFGNGDLKYWHVKAQPLLADLLDDGPPSPELFERLQPGYYAISATYLASVYLPDPGPWSTDYEERYQLLKRINAEELAHRRDPHLQTRLEQKFGQKAVIEYLRDFPALRTARLAAFLRYRQPVDNAGYSILIFKLTADDLNQALEGPAPVGK